MDYKILETINKITKTKDFNNLEENEKYEVIINSIKEIINKFLTSYEINIDKNEKLSNMILELNNNLDYSTKQTLNLELTHALINGMMAVTKHSIEWSITDNKQLRRNPIYSYDLNMTLLSIKTYSEMDLSSLSIYLIRTIESNIKESALTLITTK